MARSPLGGPETLPPGFQLLPDAIPDADAQLAALIAEVPWEDHVFRIFGRVVPMPRRIAWFGTVPYSYSGLTHPPAPMPPRVEVIRERVRELTGYSFNTVLINLYRSGTDAMGWHADDDYTPRSTTTIASVSLGAPRRFDLRAREGDARVSIVLPHASLLVMGEGTQRAWRHRLPKVSAPVGPRVNLTFRDMAE